MSGRFSDPSKAFVRLQIGNRSLSVSRRFSLSLLLAAPFFLIAIAALGFSASVEQHTTAPSLAKIELTAGHASAQFDERDGRCAIRISSEDETAATYRSVTEQRFLIEHELAHCALFYRPASFAVLRAFNSVQARLIDDYVSFDLFDELDRPSFYELSHEVYADLRPVARLLAEGVSADDLRFVVHLRQFAATFDPIHDTSQAVGALLADRTNRWAVKSDSDVRRLTAEFMLKHHLVPRLAPFGMTRIDFEGLLNSRLRDYYSRQVANPSAWRADLRNNLSGVIGRSELHSGIHCLLGLARAPAAPSFEQFAQRWWACGYPGVNVRDESTALAETLESKFSAIAAIQPMTQAVTPASTRSAPPSSPDWYFESAN